MSAGFQFSYKAAGGARLGRIETPHGAIETPAFIFCATKAAIKGLTPDQMKGAGTQMILANTYHLMLQPGSKQIEAAGGIHKFMNWDGPMLTDSGGFQIFSLGHGSVSAEIKGNRCQPKLGLCQVSEEGAIFTSHINGAKHQLTPEISMQVQREIGADFAVVLDECTPFHVSKDYTAASMEMSHRWAQRSLDEFSRHDTGRQKLYGIVQGGVYEDLRRQSTDFVNAQPFFGTAIGGSLGASKEQMYEVVDITTKMLSKERPVHLLGVGGVQDIVRAVEFGIDTFDCVHPTRIARHGAALVKNHEKEHINLANARYRSCKDPIASDCSCYTCAHFSCAYLHHLIKAREPLSISLITTHNVYFMNELMRDVRQDIARRTADTPKSFASDAPQQ